MNIRVEKLNFLEEKLKYKFSDIKKLKSALTHPSFNSNDNFQELEFLGDRVLGLVISSYLVKMNKFNIKDLSNTYNYLINAEAMYKIAISLKLEGFFMHKIEKLSKKNLSDIVESIFGAIFLDSNFEVVSKIVMIHWKEILETIENTDLINPKMKLQEYSQAKGYGLPEYEVIQIDIVNKKPIYTMNVKLNEEIFANSTGSNKNIASNNAAKELLKKINEKI